MQHAPDRALPTDVSSFVGRGIELDELKIAVTDNRLVTLTGDAGIGKTRLALRLGSLVQRSFRDGCRLVTVDEDSTADELEGVVAELLPAERASGPEWHGLIVLDGAERATEPVADAVSELLRANADLRILVTSRRRLGVTGERVLPLRPLSSPAFDRHLRQGPQPAIRSDAVGLLVERTASTVGGFAATPENIDALLAICHAVDGIPSLIEAAARAIPVLGPERLREALARDLAMLDEFPGRESRSPTMRAAFDEAYGACSDAERSLWRRLSVFPGGFDFDAALAVAADDTDPARLAAVLAGLVERSALLPDPEGGAAFRMLAPTRVFASRELHGSGEATEVGERFDDFLVGVMSSAAQDWFTHRQAAWAAVLARHHSEIFDLLERYSCAPATARIAMTLICDLRFYWQWRTTGPETRARDWLDAAFQADLTDDALRVRALEVDAYFALFENDVAGAAEQLAAARALATRIGAGERDDFATFVGGVLDLALGRLGEAERAFEDALAAALADGKRPSLGELYWYLALLRLLNGRVDEAERLCEESRAISTETGDNWGNAYTLWMIALMTLRSGDNERALNLVRQSIAVMNAFEDRSGVALCVRLMASIATSRGDYEQAAKLIGSIAGNSVIPELSISEITPELAGRVRDELGEGLFGRLFGSSASLSPSEAIAYAIDTVTPATAPPVTATAGASILTVREAEIAELVAAGHGNADIAATLFISRRTVEGHVQRILGKLEFRSRSQIAAWVAGNRAREALPDPR
ncbi:hypothetical protein GCM10027416_01200 [Okibacterium endophyticum]